MISLESLVLALIQGLVRLVLGQALGLGLALVQQQWRDLGASASGGPGAGTVGSSSGSGGVWGDHLEILPVSQGHPS